MTTRITLTKDSSKGRNISTSKDLSKPFHGMDCADCGLRAGLGSGTPTRRCCKQDTRRQMAANTALTPEAILAQSQYKVIQLPEGHCLYA